jgi:uncharacterized protein
MKVIDAHVHLGGEDVKEQAKLNGIDYNEKGLLTEMKHSDVSHCGLMIAHDENYSTFKAVDILTKIVKRNENVSGIIVVDPKDVGGKLLRLIQEKVNEGVVKGIKIALGYRYFYPHDKVYEPVYKLANKLKIPVMFHTGDTLGSKAMIKYTHPLHIDEVAVRFPSTNFIMAHLGNPWITDACEIIYKNPNVYADLSGFLEAGQKLSKRETEGIKEAFEWLETGDRTIKILYGSDWPLVRMNYYVKLMKSIVPKKFHKDVFFDNAKSLFNL